MPEPSHVQIISEVRVLGEKIDNANANVSAVRSKLEENSSRLDKIEKWVEAHDAVIRFAKWGAGLTLAAVSVALAAWRLKSGS